MIIFCQPACQVSILTFIPTRLITVDGVKVGVQQSMPNHSPVGSEYCQLQYELGQKTLIPYCAMSGISDGPRPFNQGKKPQGNWPVRQPLQHAGTS